MTDDAKRPEAWREIVDRVELWTETLKLPSLGLVLVDLDGDQRFHTYGSRDVVPSDSFGPETLFPIGSLTKGFTAVLAAMLVREGRLDWEDLVLRHLADLRLTDPALEMRLTVRDLFCQKSGLGNCDLLCANATTAAEVIAELASAETFDPDQSFLYTNVNYLLAGEVVSRVAGSPFKELLQQRILEPLGMNETMADSRRFLSAPNRARGYWQPLGTEGTREPAPFLAFDTCVAAGGIQSTLQDLARWLRFLLTATRAGGSTLLESQDLERLWAPQVPVSPGVGYGMGFKIGVHRGFKMVFHEGNLPGFSASLCLLPELGAGFVLIQGSSDTPLQERIYRDLWDLWLPGAPEAPQVSVTFPGSAPAAHLGLAPMHFRALDGSLTCSIFVEGDRLGLDVPGQLPVRLEGPSRLGIYYSERNQFLGPSLIRQPGEDVPRQMLLYHFLNFPGERLPLGVAPATRADGVTALDPAHLPGRYRIHHVGKDVEVRLAVGGPVVDIPEDATYRLVDPLKIGRWLIEPTQLQGLEFHGNGLGPARALTWKVVKPLEMQRIDLEVPPVEADELLALRHRAYGHFLEDGSQCLELQGTVSYVHQGIRGQVKEWTWGLDRYRFEEDLGRFGSQLRLRHGDRVWSRNAVPGQPLRELDGDEKTAAVSGLQLVAALAGVQAASGALRSLHVLGHEECSGRDCLRVWVQPHYGYPLTHWICAEAGRILRTTQGVETVLFEDFRPVGELEIPFRRTTEVPLAGRRVLDIDSASLLPQAPEGVFAGPYS